LSREILSGTSLRREVRLLFTRANVLNRRFSMCSVPVKITLFRSFCICFYGMALWKRYNVATISRLRSCYVKCMQLFFGYSKYHSVTSMLIELALPSFDTLIINSRVRLSHQCQSTQNGIIGHTVYAAYILFNVCLLSTVCFSLYLFVFRVFMFYGLKPEINAFIH